MKTSAFVLGMAIAGAGVSVSAGRGAVSTQDVNACAMVTASDVQSLAAKMSVGEGVPSAQPAIGAVSCRYTWGAGVDKRTVNVVVTDQARMFPGMNADQIKQRLAASVKAGTTDAVIADVGQGAVFKADSPYYATATAVVKGRILEVHVDGLDARQKKDELVSLLKTAAARF